MVAMRSTHPPITPLDPEVALFRSRRVRQATVGSETWFSLTDVLGRLDRAMTAEGLGVLLERAGVADRSAFFEEGGVPEPALPREDVLRVVALLDSHAARRVQAWVVGRSLEADRLEARQGMDDASRDHYRRRGESEAWILARQHTRDTRRSLVTEWNRRGARTSADFRLLTNRLFEGTFGLAVADFRAARDLPASASLRDHLSDLELSLVDLAESLAGQFARHRDGQGMSELLEATSEAGEVAAVTRRALEGRISPSRADTGAVEVRSQTVAA